MANGLSNSTHLRFENLNNPATKLVIENKTQPIFNKFIAATLIDSRPNNGI